MPARRVLISIDERLLARVDRAATRRDLTRSGYLADLAVRDIGAGESSRLDPVVTAALQALDGLFADVPDVDHAGAIREFRGRK